MNKNESKYFNTAVKMDKALITLLEKKDFEYITITEICEAAGVNRSTFYLHYENTFDLLKETTKYILDTFLSYFSVEMRGISNRYTQSELKDLVFITPEYLTPYLTFIKENRRVFKTSIKHLKIMGFDNVHQKLFTHIIDPILVRFHYAESERTYVAKFYLSGITAIVNEWIDNNCTDSIDTVIQIIIVCVMGKNTENGWNT